MDPQYHQFGLSDNSFAREEPKIMTLSGMKRMVGCVLYSILVLLLLIVLMVIGIKFSQLNHEISDVKLRVDIIGHGRKMTPTTTVEEVHLEQLLPVRGTCRAGWVSFQSSCYMWSNTSLSWSNAEAQCRKLSGHLVVLNNVEELDYLSKVIELNQNYWIGLVEREYEGHWSWVDGTDVKSTTMFWDLGQPDDWDFRVNGEDCGQLHPSGRRTRRLWNDADCQLGYKYICESRQ
ncbi:asialoglycoprotein receptor-like 1 [Betta splendens]|uniref:Asialoglycoprotein receptor-like 1 n=1 Tax=Betta splendens TaxID=158456 RepID=A0A6P7NI67_BETSP|nr:asialoglycoprotein receptor-like 1 [Betta splendens]